MPKLFRLVLVVPTLAIMALASATAAFADNGVTISVDPTANLTAKVEVVVTVTASCPAGWFPMGSQVIVEQAVGNSIAHGSAFIPIQCTGANQIVPVPVLADPTGPHFKNGSAIVTANMFACFSTCGSAQVITTVRIR